MVEERKISPRISRQAHALLQQLCKDRRCTQAEAVDAAILAFVTPREDGTPQEVALAKLDGVHQKLDTLLRLMETLVPKQAPEPEPMQVASYDDLYTPEDATPAIAPPVPRLGRIRRWLLKEDRP